MAPKIYTWRRRIGVTGLYNSGKTVFLTSLINHLRDHDPSLLPMGDGEVSARRFQPLPAGDGRAAFNYEGNRDSLVNKGSWPEKTADVSYYRCSFERSDWRFTRAELEFFDFPGERIADVVMVEHGSYSRWSDFMLGHLANQGDYREHAGDFLALQKKDAALEEQLVHAYKLAMANLILNYKPLVSPSTFLLGTSGDRAAMADAETVARQRSSGISQTSQFAPMSARLRELDPGLARAFESRFDDYVSRVASPITSYLKDCHRLVVLVDITTLLAAGVGMYDDNREILELLLHALDPGAGLLDRAPRALLDLFQAGGILKWRPAGITRIAFAASKADKVHPDDRARMVGLLKKMIWKKAADVEGLRTHFNAVSAVVSTESVDSGSSFLAGFPIIDEKGDCLGRDERMRKYRVSRVPEEWDAQWKEGDYCFPDVYPLMPRRRDLPPRQIGMSSVLEFLMDEDFAE